MTMTLKTLASLSIAATLLAGCTSMNIFKDDSSAPQVNDLPPEEPIMDAPAARAPGMSPSQVSKALSGKSWKWSAPNFSGVTLFANDGSSLIELKKQGSLAPVTTTGRWRTQQGAQQVELCESINAAPPVLNNKVPETCKPVSGGGNQFKVGSATFVLDN
jgi:hypothetical protein